jgi:hypothetical protein
MFYVESVTIGRRSLFSRIWQSFKITCEIIGYSRAAAHLASLGYYKESNHCMMQIAKLKNNK